MVNMVWLVGWSARRLRRQHTSDSLIISLVRTNTSLTCSSEQSRSPSQSRQSPKLFLKSSGLGLPQPLTRRRLCPPPPPPVLGRGAHPLAREGLGESQFRRGDIHCGTLYINVLCVVTIKEISEEKKGYTSSLNVCPANQLRNSVVVTGEGGRRKDLCRRRHTVYSTVVLYDWNLAGKMPPLPAGR